MKTDTVSSRSSRRSAGMQSILNLLLVAAILAMVNYLGFKFYSHADLSKSQFYTLSPKTIDVLKKLDSPVSVTTLLNPKDPTHADQIDKLLKEYQIVAGKNMTVEKIDLAYDMARATELQKRLHFEATDFLVIFEYKDHSRFVKLNDLYDANSMTGQSGNFKGEQKFTSTFVSLIEGKTSKVYFTEGHGEHPLQDSYGIAGSNLKQENVEAANLNLAQKGDVPTDADAVVIAGPSISFSPIEVQALDKYLQNNGKLLILLDPYVVLGMDDLLKKYALKYEDDMVLYRGMTTTGSQMTVPLALIYQGGFSPHPITTKFAQANLQLQLTNARSITLLPDEKGQPNPKTLFLLQTDPDAFGWINKSGAAPADPRQLTYNKTTDIAGPVTVAAEYDGGMTTDPATKAMVPATRIVLVGSSKFLENDNAESVGMNFFTNCIDWLVKKDAVLDIAPKTPQEYGISLSPMQVRTVSWVSLFFVPGAALVMGIFTWFSRRK